MALYYSVSPPATLSKAVLSNFSIAVNIAFPWGKICRVFTSLEDAKYYAEHIYPKNSYAANQTPAILTFETDEPIAELLTSDSITFREKGQTKTIPCYSLSLDLQEVKPQKLDFPKESNLPSIVSTPPASRWWSRKKT